MTTLAETLTNFFVKRETTLSATVEALKASHQPSADTCALISLTTTDETLKSQMLALVTMLSETNPNDLPASFATVIANNGELFSTTRPRFDVANDSNGILMLSRGNLKAAFNTGENALGVAPGDIQISNLYNPPLLEPKGYTLYKI
ncbi:MAG: hypothetical protein LBI43_02710 [Streptococcaceae bacterium]|jgi:hypothetical protein|nr:hypothetical protein [Streptococcaceae bacterium]